MAEQQGNEVRLSVESLAIFVSISLFRSKFDYAAFALLQKFSDLTSRYEYVSIFMSCKEVIHICVNFLNTLVLLYLFY